MEFDLDGADQPLAYKLLASLVTPRPIALVTTLSDDGVINAAPFSFFNVLGSRPPIVGFCPGDREPGVPKDTAINLRQSQEFVVNLVDESIAQGMNQCAAELPFGQSELSSAGFTTLPSMEIAVPRIAESAVHLECREWGTLQIGQNRLVIGLVLRLHLRDQLWDPASKRIRVSDFHPVGRMHGADGYCYTRDQFQMARPD
ncbi:MAG: flavin reductase family protein [Verrucomicrobiota bacterium]